MRPISSSVRSIFICGEYHKEDTKRLVLKGRKRSERFAPKEASQETSYRSPSALEPSVGELKNLSSLSIIETNIAALPDELGLLSKLRFLELRHNRLIKRLPDSLRNCSALEHLNVSHSRLDVLPSTLSRSLVVVYLQANAFKEMPDVLCTCENIRILSMADNCIAELPAEIGRLSSLRELDMRKNDLSRLPGSLASGCRELERIMLDDNKVKSLGHELEQLERLRHLSLKNNELEHVPVAVPKLKMLQTLDLRGNHIQTVDVNLLRGLTKLQKLSIENNPLIDPIFGGEPRTAQTKTRFNPEGIELYHKVRAAFQIRNGQEDGLATSVGDQYERATAQY